MKIIKEMGIKDFEAWSGAVETKKIIIDKGMAEEFDSLIKAVYPEGINETHLNDILWYNAEAIFEILGISEE